MFDTTPNHLRNFWGAVGFALSGLGYAAYRAHRQRPAVESGERAPVGSGEPIPPALGGASLPSGKSERGILTAAPTCDTLLQRVPSLAQEGTRGAFTLHCQCPWGSDAPFGLKMAFGRAGYKADLRVVGGYGSPEAIWQITSKV